MTRIADTVTGETRTIKVTSELDNPGGRLRPEMFGELRYADGTAQLPWVPAAALVRIGEKDIVFVEQSRGHFLATPVDRTRFKTEDRLSLRDLLPGDRVVTQGSVYLKAAL